MEIEKNADQADFRRIKTNPSRDFAYLLVSRATADVSRRRGVLHRQRKPANPVIAVKSTGDGAGCRHEANLADALALALKRTGSSLKN